MKVQRFEQHQRGVGIVEALVALLVLALGMMSFTALQARLRQYSDLAKQRVEAVRIAEQELESFRAFGTLARDDTVVNNFAYDSVSAGAPPRAFAASAATLPSNTSFSVARALIDAPSVEGVSDAPVKNLAVTVSWTDRMSATQSITLRTVISKSDPALAAALALAPNGTPVRALLGRNILVPTAAKNLGNGSSAFKPLMGGAVAYVFSSDAGLVTRKCSGLAGTVTTQDLTLAVLSGAGITCASVNAYLVSGFIRTALSDSAQAVNPNDTAPGGLAMRVDFDNTPPPTNAQGRLNQLTAAHWPVVDGATGITIGTGTMTHTPAECSVQALQSVRYTTPVSFTQVNDGVAATVDSTVVLASIPQSVTAITPDSVAPWVGVAAVDANAMVIAPQATGDRFVAYACLVYPIDLDLDAKTPPAYSARVAVWPSAGWALGTANGSFKVCRYAADANHDGGVRVLSGSNVTGIDNLEHPYAYLNAQSGLGNQNFLIVPGQRTCPSNGGVEVDGQQGANYTAQSTVTHQP